MEKLWRAIGIKAKVEEIREIGRKEGKRGRMMKIKLKMREEKIDIIKKKKILKEKKRENLK